jgi:hypothetical protein
MRCETARTAMSEAMDDLRAVAPSVTDHVSSCAECRDFLHGVRRIRELTRFEIASDVPDLAPAIMARVEKEAEARRGRRSRRRAVRRPRLHGPRRRGDPRTRRVVGVGLAAGLVTGAVLTGGGLVSVNQTNTAALADVIPARLNGVASTLEGYRATFDITELDWTRAVPQRTFVADLAFREPESFVVRVHDTTRYPSAAWPRNDLSLVSDGHMWQASGPNPCPRAELPACPQSQPVVRTVIDRMPFDASTAMPTDVIVPMTVLAASERVDVVGPVTVDGRAAIVVELTYQDATPLFGCLQFLGSWRLFYPTDRVLVALDEETWLPLRYQVYPAPSGERAAWAAAEGLPRESPTAPVFTATIRSVSTQVPPPDTFTVPSVEGAVDEGFHDLPLSSVALVAQATLIEPTQTEGLPVVRIGTLARTPARPYQAVTFAYARGLSWLTITRVTSWEQQAPFGVGPLAEVVPLLRGSGVALYEPASANDPRRLALHTDQGEFLVASNLPRSDLVAVASSLPVKGLALPETWSNRTWYGGSVRGGLGVEDAIFQAGFDVLLPRVLPTGYSAAAALLVQSGDSKGITITYRRPAAELGDGLLLTEATGQPLPPPSGADQQVVSLRGTLARWSPDQGRLEWIENGLYCSLAGPGFGLADLVSIAASLRGV